MISLGNVNHFNRTLTLYGLSTDTKPIDKFEQDDVSRYAITNGSTFVEIDTGDEYMFDDSGNTWNKMEGSGGASKRMVVDELPTEDIDPNTTYLVANDSGNAENAYTEYMYVNDGWEALGPYVANVWVAGAAPGSAMLSGSKSSISSSATYAVAEGYSTTASGANSHAEGGGGNTASSSGAHVEGNGGNTASGAGAHAEGGGGCRATAQGAHAEGGGTTASGSCAHAEGGGTTASGSSAHAEGQATTASGGSAHAEGSVTDAKGNGSHAEGAMTVADGTSAHVEGQGIGKDSNGNYKTITVKGVSYTPGAHGLASHAEGYQTVAGSSSIKYSHAEGYQTVAIGDASHAEGYSTIASNTDAHAEGAGTKASGNVSHAEGSITTASGNVSHAEGTMTTASGDYSHAEGDMTTASGQSSHAEGQSTTASGRFSHAEGDWTKASGAQSHAEGYYTTANHASQHVFGEYNIEDGSLALGTERGSYIEIVGNGEMLNGSSTIVRSNARTLDWSGNEWLAGNVSVEDVMLPLEEGSDTRMSLLDKIAELSSSSGGGSGIKREIVNTLPTTDIDPDTIYLIADSDGSGDNTYIEYMYVNDTWEALGSYIPDIWERGTGINSAVLKGDNNTATGTSAVAIGQYSSATNTASFAEGFTTRATGPGAHSEGENSTASGYASHAEGFYTSADQTAAHAEGMNTQANGQGSHAEGNETTASGKFAHSEGLSTTASAMAAHAEGDGASATQTGAHAEGRGTTASGEASHAEGAGSKAYGVGAHAEGGGTIASGGSSHAEGGGTTASGEYSHAEGGQTIANHKSQHVFGEWNIEDGSSALGTEHGSYIEIVGNGGIPDGGSTAVRSNARTLDWNGNEWLAGNVSVEDVMLPLEDGSNTRTSLLDKLDAFDTDVTNLSENITNLSTNITNVVAQQVEQMQIHEGQTVIDSTLTVQGAAADAKKTGDELANLSSALAQIVPGLSDDAKVALLACFEHVAWSDGSGQEYYDALEDALYDTYPKITVLYSPGSHIVYDDDTLDSLKPYLTVTYYETSEDEGTVISASSYTLSGILVAGISTITVTYNALQTNFKVTALDHDFYWSYPDDRLTVLEAGLTRDDNFAYHAMFVDYTKQYTKATFGTSSQYGYAPFKLLTDHQTDTALYPVPVPSGATKCHVKYTPDPGATTPTCQIIMYYFESPTWRTRSYMPSSPTSDTEFDIDFSAVIAEDIAGGHEYIYALSIGASDSNDTRKQKYLSLSLAFS